MFEGAFGTTDFFGEEPRSPGLGGRTRLSTLVHRLSARPRSAATSVVEFDDDVGKETPQSATSSEVSDFAEMMRRLIVRIQSSTRSNVNVQLGRRIKRAWRLVEEEDETSVAWPIDPGALSGLVKFVTTVALHTAPQIGVSAGGTLTAEWRVGQNRILTIHFLNDALANFALAKPAPNASERRMSIFGTAPIAAIEKIIRDNGAGAWILDTGR